MTEQAEIVQQKTLAAQQFSGKDPIIEACKAWPELAGMNDRDFLIEKLEEDKKLRMEVCAKHDIVRYVLQGVGFEFPTDEQLPQNDPEVNQIWNMNEADFDQAADKVKEKEEAISSCSTANSQDIQAITEMQRDLEKMMPKDKAIMSPIEQEFLDFVY